LKNPRNLPSQIEKRIADDNYIERSKESVDLAKSNFQKHLYKKL
jgi:hypothetical protein